ncbi:hypothetical protein BC938DRAFT_471052, partial [Jimgerdemannia flammicorona]
MNSHYLPTVTMASALSLVLSSSLYISFSLPFTITLVSSFIASLVLCLANPAQTKSLTAYPLVLIQSQLYWCLSFASCVMSSLLVKFTHCDSADDTIRAPILRSNTNDSMLSTDTQSEPLSPYPRSSLLSPPLTPLSIRTDNLLSPNEHPDDYVWPDSPVDLTGDDDDDSHPRATPPASPKLISDDNASTHHRRNTTSIVPIVLDELRSKFHRRHAPTLPIPSKSTPTCTSTSPTTPSDDAPDFRPTVYQERHGITCPPAWWKKTQLKVSHAVGRVKDHKRHRDEQPLSLSPSSSDKTSISSSESCHSSDAEDVPQENRKPRGLGIKFATGSKK